MHPTQVLAKRVKDFLEKYNELNEGDITIDDVELDDDEGTLRCSINDGSGNINVELSFNEF